MAGLDATESAQREAQDEKRRRAQAVVDELARLPAEEEPYELYARLREIAPAFRTGSGVTYLTGYDDCLAIIRDTTLRAQSPAWMDRVQPGWRDHPGLLVTHESFIFRDPPDHTRLRRPVSGPFTYRQIDTVRGYIAGRIELVLDQIAESGAGGGPVDLHELLAKSLPISVIGKIVGVPEADQQMLREPLEGLRLAVDGSNRAGLLPKIDAAAVALTGYFASLIAERRAHPRDDLTSDLATLGDRAGADGRGGPLTEDELVQTVTLTYSAAIESMVDLLLNGMGALLTHPAQADALRRDPGLAESAVEEALRYDSAAQMLARIPAEDYHIGGVTIPAGEYIVALIGAANRDPARFGDPETFDITRTGPSPLSFGGGVHHCLGASLARVQAAMFFPAILARFPALRVAGPLVRRGSVLRGFAQFPVAIR